MLNGRKSSQFFRLALAAAFFSYLGVVFIAYSRLSEAGLGCPDWPGCYEKLFTPLTAHDLDQAKLLGRDIKPENRAWKEMVQRYLSGVLGLLLLRLAWLGWQLKRRKRSQQILIPLATMLLTFSLTVAGALTVSFQLKPLIMMMQLLGGMTILGALWWIVMREQKFWRSVSASPVTRSLRPRTLAALVILSLQIALGGWSMVNYAGLACPDFPSCQGQWWPAMDYLNAFTLWRDVGIQYEGKLLDLPSATAIHMAHRVGALISVLYVGWLALHVMRVGFQENLTLYGLLVLLLLAEEILLGITQVAAHLPLVLAVAHNAVAGLLLLSLITLYHVVRPPRTP
ncbi:MAG: COX15/CtaA family protein [Sulfuricaulis sp.]|nr:COX15/CtaA family protein [Sulfuricaulis sp.]